VSCSALFQRAGFASIETFGQDDEAYSLYGNFGISGIPKR
jgi:hypothetical protein